MVLKKLILLFALLPALAAHAIVTGQLWYATTGAGPDAVVGHINSDGTAVVVNSVIPTNAYTLGLDLPAGLFFAGNSDHLTVSSYRISDGALLDTLQVGDTYGTADTLDDDLVCAVTVDPINHILFVNRWDGDTAHSGIVKITYNPATGDLNNNGAYNSGSQQFLVTGAVVGTNYINAPAMEIDIATHKLYYTDWDNNYNISPFVPVNAICVVSDYTAASPTVTKLTSQTQFPVNGSNGFLGGIAVDDAKSLIYFTSLDYTDPGKGHLWYMPIAGGTATKILDLDNMHLGDSVPCGLTLDPVNQQLYMALARYPAFVTTNANHIIRYQLSADGHSVTFLGTYSLTNLIGHAPADSLNNHPAATEFDQLPIPSVTGTTAHAVEQSASISLATAVSITDADGAYLRSATVQVTGGIFAGAGDVLAATTAGTSISASYNSSTEMLTLTNYDTLAHYQTVLQSVTFQANGNNPNNYGTNGTRTITWTVSDGALSIPAGSQNSTTTTITIDAVNDAPTNTVPPLITATNGINRYIPGISIQDVDASPGGDGMTVTLLVTNGTITLRTDAAGGLVGGNITANGTANVTVNATQNSINATFAAANGILYLASTTQTNDTLKVTTSDNGHTGSGGTLQDLDTVAITVLQPPVITSGNTTTFMAGSPGTFTVTATAFPVATFVEIGPLPGGVGFNTNSGVLSGTPSGGTGGVYPITLKAHNVTSIDATQSFTLTVNEAPTMNCSSDIATNAAGYCPSAVAFASTAGGYPAPAISYKIGATPIASPYNFPVGTNVVTVTATNIVGTNTCNFAVKVAAGAPPALKVVRVGTSIVVSWTNAVPCYVLQFAPFVSSNSWTAYPGPFATNGGVVFVTNAPPFTNRFYRLAY